MELSEAKTLLAHANALVEQEQYAEVEAPLRQVLALTQDEAALASLTVVLCRLGRAGEAETLLRQALNLEDGALEASHLARGTLLQLLAAVLTGQRKNGEAERLLRRRWCWRREPTTPGMEPGSTRSSACWRGRASTKRRRSCCARRCPASRRRQAPSIRST